MDITITFDNGRWSIDPSPALVVVGTHVRFVLRAPRSQMTRLRWVVSFEGGSPFEERRQWSLETRNSGLGTGGTRLARQAAELLDEDSRADIAFDHRAATEPVSADQPGDYKYDLRVENPETDETVGDEDPLLIVLRGPFRVWF
jgi:hypothetical protein